MTGHSGNSEFCFPTNLNVPLGFALGNIEVSEKQNSLFPLGRVIKCLLICISLSTAQTETMRCQENTCNTLKLANQSTVHVILAAKTSHNYNNTRMQFHLHSYNVHSLVTMHFQWN